MSFLGSYRALASTAVVVIVIVLSAYVLTSSPGTATGQVPSRFTVNGRSYTFNYAASTESEREAGLMGKSITNNTTMVFAFPRSDYWQFWMYGTNTSLDIIWINSTGDGARVVYLVQGAPLCSGPITCPKYTPTSPANYAIEAKAGFAQSNGIAVGTQVIFAWGKTD